MKNAPIQGICSVKRKTRVPAIRSVRVVLITTLEWRVSFRKERFLRTSRITRKPRPPKIIRPPVTRFSRISFW